MRLRTTETTGAGTMGSSATNSEVGSARTELTHVVARWNKMAGTMTFTINGSEDLPNAWPGNLQGMGGEEIWSDANQLGIANEVGGRRAFHGAYYSVAIWCRPLSSFEVGELFAAGPR